MKYEIWRMRYRGRGKPSIFSHIKSKHSPKLFLPLVSESFPNASSQFKLKNQTGITQSISLSCVLQYISPLLSLQLSSLISLSLSHFLVSIFISLLLFLLPCPSLLLPSYYNCILPYRLLRARVLLVLPTRYHTGYFTKCYVRTVWYRWAEGGFTKCCGYGYVGCGWCVGGEGGRGGGGGRGRGKYEGGRKRMEGEEDRKK